MIPPVAADMMPLDRRHDTAGRLVANDVLRSGFPVRAFRRPCRLLNAVERAADYSAGEIPSVFFSPGDEAELEAVRAPRYRDESRFRARADDARTRLLHCLGCCHILPLACGQRIWRLCHFRTVRSRLAASRALRDCGA